MRRYLRTLWLLPVFWVALSVTSAKAEDLFIDDEFEPDAQTTAITLAWDSGQSVVGYNLYFGRASGTYLGFVTVAKTSAVVSVKGVRKVYFAVTAFNADGVESDFSDELQWP